MRKKQLSMYSVIPTRSGTLTDWAAQLSQVRDMHFDTVYFLPLTAMGGSESPYSISDHFALDPSYIPPGKGEDPRQLEEIVNPSGLRCCFDLVLNHVADDGKLAHLHPEWIQKEGGRFKHARYFFENQWHEWGDLVLLDYDHPDPKIREQLWDHMLNYARLWSDLAAQTDGSIRLDNLHSSHQGFVHFLLDKLHNEFPNLVILGELFTDQPSKKNCTMI